jgi:hypothetical protein
MVSEADKYTPQSAKLTGEYLFGGLLLFGLVIFCLLISTDCYLNSVTCEVSVAAFVVALGVAIVVAWWRDRVASEKGEDMLKQIAAPIVMGFFYGCVVLYGVLSLIIVLTARDLVQSPSRIYAAGRGRGCRGDG